MNRMSWFKSLSVAALVLGTASMTLAANTDGFDSDGGPAAPTLSNSTTFGVTHGVQSLASTLAPGGFWGPTTGNLVTLDPHAAADLQSGAARYLQFAVTFIGTQLPAGVTFAQSNEIAGEIVSPALSADPSNSGFFQVNFSNDLASDHTSIGATDSSGSGPGGTQANATSGGSAQWGGANNTDSTHDHTAILTWDLTSPLFSDKNGSGLSFAAALAAGTATDLKFSVVEQFNGNAALPPATNNGTFFFDNFVLRANGTVDSNGVPIPGAVLDTIGDFEPTAATPEPASIGLLALSGLLALRRRA
jgi:hypothetical protein